MGKQDKLVEDRISLTPTGYVPVHISKDVVPANAVRMSDGEVLDLQNKRVKAYPVEETFWLKMSQYITMGCSGVTAALINTHFRTKFQIRNQGALLSFPVLLMPSLFARAMDYFMTQKVMLLPKCQGCLEVKSGLVNVGATLFPALMLSPSVAIMISKKHYTYLTNSDFQPGIKHVLKSKPSHWAGLAALAAFNFLLAAAIRHEQRKEIDRITDRCSKFPTIVDKLESIE